MERPAGIAAYRIRIPLTKPYRLAFGTVERYDTILVSVTGSDGRTGIGEATMLTGYTDETIDDGWAVAQQMVETLRNVPLEAGRTAVHALAATHPFTATAFGTALEMLVAPERFCAPTAAVPLLGLVDAKGNEAIARQVDALLAGGYRTLKAKVGFEVDADLAFVRAVQRACRGRARVRIDANQGYSAEQGVAFVRRLDPEGIELFEQPCAAGDWDSHLRVARAAEGPLMLDESIYGLEDIEKAASLQCAQFIKVKLMKLGTLDALATAIAQIRAHGMKPVLGNGVACDPGCWLEALVASEHIDNAGEMNGFLKIRASLLEPHLKFEAGAIHLEPGVPRLDFEAIRRYSVDSFGVSPKAALRTPA